MIVLELRNVKSNSAIITDFVNANLVTGEIDATSMKVYDCGILFLYSRVMTLNYPSFQK